MLSRVPLPLKIMAVVGLAYLAYDYKFGLMEIMSSGEWKNRYIHRVYGPTKSDEPLPMILVFHGSGADEKDLLPVFENVSYGLRVISFRGFYTSGIGYNWAYGRGENMLDARVNHDRILKGVVGDFARGVTELTLKYPTKGQPMVFGYSRGSCVVLQLAADHYDRFSAYFSLSGFLEPGIRPQDLEYSREYRPIFHYHGNNDPVVGIGKAKESISWLQKHFAYVYFNQHNRGHSIPAAVEAEILTKMKEISSRF